MFLGLIIWLTQKGPDQCLRKIWLKAKKVSDVLGNGLKNRKNRLSLLYTFCIERFECCYSKKKNALPLADVKRPILSVCITCIFWILGLYNIYAWELWTCASHFVLQCNAYTVSHQGRSFFLLSTASFLRFKVFFVSYSFFICVFMRILNSRYDVAKWPFQKKRTQLSKH